MLNQSHKKALKTTNGSDNALTSQLGKLVDLHIPSWKFLCLDKPKSLTQLPILFVAPSVL